MCVHGSTVLSIVLSHLHFCSFQGLCPFILQFSSKGIGCQVFLSKLPNLLNITTNAVLCVFLYDLYYTIKTLYYVNCSVLQGFPKSYDNVTHDIHDVTFDNMFDPFRRMYF